MPTAPDVWRVPRTFLSRYGIIKGLILPLNLYLLWHNHAPNEPFINSYCRYTVSVINRRVLHDGFRLGVSIDGVTQICFVWAICHVSEWHAIHHVSTTLENRRMALGSETLSISGVKIELTQCGGDESPALLYLHGGLGREQSTVFLAGLAQQFRVIAPTHPGFGASSWPQHIRSVSDLSFFYLDLADHLKLHDAVLVGACFGGWLAAEMLVRSTERFGHLVLIDALGVKFSDRLSRDITDLHGFTEAEVAETLYYNPIHAAADYVSLSDEALQAIARNREAFTYFGWKPYMYNPSLRHWLHRIDIPTLLVWGAQDRFVSADYAKRYADAIPHSDLHLVPEAGHYPHVERPKLVLDRIRRFVATGKDQH